MTSMFRPATRKKSKLRMAIDGVSGSGKSFTGLRFAFALGKRVAVINSESGAIEKYLDLNPDGIPWQFDICELSNFAPSSYTQAILAAGSAGYDVLLIDSLSHAWAGSGGALEIKDKKGGNSFTAWKDITPMHNAMIEAILRSPCHIIATMRSKTGYVLETDSNGKQVPRKVGMEPVQRQGMEYEFDIYASIDSDHVMRVSKSRCPALDGAVIVKPEAAAMEPVSRWLNDGAQVDPGFYAVTEKDLQRLAEVNRKAEKEEAAKQPKKTAMEIIQEQAKKEEAVKSSPTVAESSQAPVYSTHEQHAEMLSLMAACYPEDQHGEVLNGILSKRGVKAMHSLLWTDVHEIAAKLQAKKRAMEQEAATLADKSTNTTADSQPSVKLTDPCTPVQIERIKLLLGEHEQEKPGTVKEFKARLTASGRATLSELTIEEGDLLIHALLTKQLENYLANSLSKKGGNSPTDEIPF